MQKAANAFPVLPGKDARDVSSMLKARPSEYAESRRALGVHMERAYEQVTPMGTFLVVYTESDDPFGEVIGRGAQSDRAIDRDFVAAVKEVHGVDAANPPALEPAETLAAFEDPAVPERKRGLAFIAPVMPGATQRGREFAKEAWERRLDEHTASRRKHGITREVVTLNHTPGGDVICVYIEGDDPVEGNRRFAESRDEYDVWFKDQCKQIFPPEIDFNEPLPPITEVFDSEDALVAR